jgi:putative tryptophan/tyrosine transport system substrate-binding protein
MGKKAIGVLLVGLALVSVHLAEAQQPTKIPRIGYLAVAPLSAESDRIEAFRQGLRELGYVEGKNIVIEWRSADGKPDRMPTLAAELVQLKVDVIVTAGSGATRPSKAATSTIPIVMAQDADPVVNGFVASLARPGGNVTGLSSLASEISGKQLELLKEIVPKLSRAAVFGTSTRAEDAKALDEIKRAAGTMKVQIQYPDVSNLEDIESAFRAAAKRRAEAFLWHVSGSVSGSHRPQIIELAAKSRRPAIYNGRFWVEEGGLMFYGANSVDLHRRAASYVDKILKGATPADLPVEQPMKFEFVINLKTAKQISVTIPPNVLARADKVIR